MDVQKPHSLSRGSWTAIVLVLVGVLAGLLAVGYWWKLVVEVPPVSGAAAGAAPFDAQAAQQALQTLQEPVAKAIEQRRAKDLLPRVQELVERYPRFAPARTLWAQLFIETGRFDKAYEQILLSLQLDPKQPELRVLAGTIAARLGKPDEAQRHYNLAIDLNPKESRYRLLLAQLYLERKEFDRARDVLLQTLYLDSTCYKAYGVLAEVYAQQNKLTLALTQVQKAIDLTPPAEQSTRLVYLRRQAEFLRRDNRPDEALQVLAGLPAKDQIELPILGDMAACWAMLGQPARAAQLYENRLALDPSDYLAALSAAHWRIKAGNPAAAHALLDTARQINPRAPEIAGIERELK